MEADVLSRDDDGFAALVRTGRSVRATAAAPPARRARGLGPLVVLGVVVAAGIAILGRPHPTAADAAADNSLYVLTNQDRASNGVPAVRFNPTLTGIGESSPYSPCGATVNGRSQDMISRSYFAHPIPPCNAYVFVMMQQAGIAYQSAGENIGWVANIPSGDPAGATGYVNSQFMGSPEHKSNILDANYTDMGVGSAYTAGPWTYSGGGGPYNEVWMFSEEFAQIASAPPPVPPTEVPAPPPRNSPGPPPPAVTPLQTAVATPTPAVATPAPGPVVPIEPLPPPPLIYQGGGLLSDSVESVLESYLIN